MESFRIATLTQSFRRRRLSRRAALASAGAGLSTTLLGRVGLSPKAALAQDATPVAETAPGENLPPDVPAWMRTPGAPSSPYAERAPAEESVVRLAPNPVVSFSPLADLHGTLTPNALFYEIHFGGIPAIDPSEHRLLVHGLVERPTLFTMEDLKRFPSVSVTHFLECAGNSFSEWTEASMSPTVQLSHGWTSSAEWTGVPLATILREVGHQAGWRVAAGGGGGCRGTQPQHPHRQGDGGCVARLCRQRRGLAPRSGVSPAPPAPRLRGEHERQVAAPPQSRHGAMAHPVGHPLLRRSHARWDGARVHLRHGSQVGHYVALRRATPRPDPASSRSPAWPGRDADGSRGSMSPPTAASHGQPATLQEPVLPMAWTRFRFPWQWDGQATRLQSRAIDETGYVQPTIAQLVEARGVNSFYHNNAIKTWAIAADGEVTNVYA